MSWYSQNDPRWQNSTLGSNPEGTIGQYGCYLTSFTNMSKVAGSDITPPDLNTELVAAGAFNPDDTLKGDAVMDGRHNLHYVETKHCETTAADLKYPSDDPNIQTVVEIDASTAPGVQTHFVLYYDGHTASTFRIVDSWDGTVKYLKAYGDPATIIQKFVTYRIELPQPAPAPTPAPAPEPTPAPVVSPDPVETPVESKPVVDTPPATAEPTVTPEPVKVLVVTPVPPLAQVVKTNWLVNLWKVIVRWLKRR